MWRNVVLLLLALRASAFCPDCVDTHVVRLSNAADPCSGVVLVQVGGIEGTICDMFWDMNDAAVVCRQLGCGVPISAPGGSVFGVPAGKYPLITDVNCRGDEPSVLKCRYSSTPQSFCKPKRDASVYCTGPDGIWLVNGPSVCAGRVSIKHNGVSGKVCDDGWDQRDASVVCRQLRCGAVQSYQYNSSFGNSPLPVMMGNIQCQGDESALWKCAQRGWNDKTCPTGRNAGVTCTFGANIIRLVNSGDACRGRLEVRNEDIWGTVCDNDWDLKDAEVVCRQLNCGSATRAETNNAPYKNGVFDMVFGQVRCTGREKSLFDCPRDAAVPDKCKIRRDAGVTCTGSRVFDPTVYRAPLSVDPKTSDQSLIIRGDGKEVFCPVGLDSVPQGPQRPVIDRCVLGSTGVTAGKWYWELEMDPSRSPKMQPKSGNFWELGVASASIRRNPPSYPNPTYGIWALIGDGGQFSVSDELWRFHSFSGVLYNLGIFVDYEEGLVSFYDAKKGQHIYTFTANFQENVYPYICLRDGVRISLK